MRYVRFVAMFGGLILIVATTMALIGERAELHEQQRARVVAAERLAEQSAFSTLERARALTEAANSGTDPASLIGSFDGEVAACVITDDATRCTGDDLSAVAGFAAAADASTDRDGAVISVDESDASLLVVDRAEATAAIWLPVDALVDARALAVLSSIAAEVELRPSTVVGASQERLNAQTEGERVVVSNTAPLPGAAGSVQIVASISNEVGFAGEHASLYLILFVFGVALVGLSLWTFMGDRRLLLRRATTDELTGLANRREFERRTEDALLAASRTNNGVCVLLIDLNGFKQINDVLGHQVGDQVLKTAAERLRAAVRGTDLVARWGGDEFVVLLPGVEDGTGVRSSAERISRTLGSTPVVENATVTAAIGAALYPRHGTTLEELVRAADSAMYGAKTTGVAYRLADIIDVQLVNSGADYDGPERRRPASTGVRSD